MGASLNCNSMTLGLKLSKQIYKIPLVHDTYHVYLPFKASKMSHYMPSTTKNQYPTARTAMYVPENRCNGSNGDRTGLYVPSGIVSHHIDCKGAYIAAPSGDSRETSMFLHKDLEKLHVELKHGSHTARRDWIKAIGKWSDDLDEGIENVLFECKCKTAQSTSPHAVVSTRLPDREK